MYALRGTLRTAALLPLVGGLGACDPDADVYATMFDPIRLGATHPCQLAFEPLATGQEAEKLVGISADTLRFGFREVEVDLVDPTYTPEEPWVLAMDVEEWAYVAATRTLIPSTCPLGLVLEARALVSLDHGGAVGNGEYWTSLSEGEPEFRYWSYRARIPYDRAPTSWQEAAEANRDEDEEATGFLVYLDTFEDVQVVVLGIEYTWELGISEGIFTEGTFTIVEEGP